MSAANGPGRGRTADAVSDQTQLEWLTTPPENLLSSGAPCHGSWGQLIDSVRERERDRHWHSSLLLASSEGQVTGGLAAHRMSNGRWPVNFLGRAVRSVHAGRSLELTPSDIMLVGGVSALRGGGVIRATHDVSRSERLLADLVSEAIRVSRELELHALAAFVPAPQVPAFMSGWGSTVSIHWADVWSAIDLDGCSTMDEFMARVTSKVRHTWRRSAEDVSAASWDVSVAALTGELVSEAAPLVASVKVANEEPDAPELAALRVRRWSRSVGEHLAFVCRDRRDRMLGVTFGKVVDNRLHLSEVGLAESDNRHDVYGALVFNTPVAYALNRGLRSVELGPGHPYPKRNRGATQTPLWHITDGEPT